MSLPGYTVNSDQGNFLSINRDTAKVILGNNRFENYQYSNSTGSEVTLECGTVMGRVASSGDVIPLVSTATDGSQYPIGILTTKHVVADGTSLTVSICIGGNVNQNLLVFSGSDDLDTVIEDRRLADRITGDTYGINLIASTQLSKFDN